MLGTNGEFGKVSLYITGTDLAGHPVLNGGAPGVDNDMATLVTQDDLPTTISQPSISLDRWGNNLLVGQVHEFSFSLTDPFSLEKYQSEMSSKNIDYIYSEVNRAELYENCARVERRREMLG